MKKRMISVLVLAVILTGCRDNTLDVRKPLFSVSKPEYRSNKTDERCSLGGVYFDFYNKAECSVKKLETRMNVYDMKTGKQAFTGYGTITGKSETEVKSGTRRQLCIPLDEYITVETKDGYLIDQFYISHVEYENGSVWEDTLGIYATDSME